MTPADLIAKVLAKREFWVDLEPGKRVKVRRPAEAEMPSFRGGMTPDRVARCCVGWDGFTEADLLGADVGASDPAAFSPELWETVALDNLDWLGKVSERLVASITDHLAQRKDASGN